MSEENNKFKRFKYLFQVPRLASLDHRGFLDKSGNDRRLAGLSRNERRKVAADGRRIGAQYKRILQGLLKTGVGYPVDNFIRQLAVEYTHRYASSGLHTQPVSFNYFESFCDIKLIPRSYAPYVEPAFEVNHLFGVVDYFDYITTPQAAKFELSQLLLLPEDKIFHYTPTGNIFDFTFMTPEGREYVLAGFSLIRRGTSLHWHVLGGEVFSEQEWASLSADQTKFDLEHIPPYKRAFLEDAMKEYGDTSGGPVALEGTGTVLKTSIAGETDLISSKHLGRCYMSETERSFSVLCDDPEVFNSVSDRVERLKMIDAMQKRVEGAAVLWGIAEAMFQIPMYFDFKVGVQKSVLVSAGQRVLGAKPKGGKGVGERFHYVSSLEVSELDVPTVRPVAAPYYQVETEGYWRRLPYDQFGQDKEGKSVHGRTWIKATNTWRERNDGTKKIYVKSSVSAARVKVADYLAKAAVAEHEGRAPEPADKGVLYVLRCMAMSEEVYKVGWTSGSAEERARSLSSSTGVPSSFVVVSAWKHLDPSGLEKGVHARLAQYRISEHREFFQVSYSVIRQIVEAEIKRTNHRASV